MFRDCVVIAVVVIFVVVVVVVVDVVYIRTFVVSGARANVSFIFLIFNYFVLPRWLVGS